MYDLQKIVSALIHWIFVPAIMLALFIFGANIVSRAPNKEAKTSASAGFWAGLILFVIYVITQVDSLRGVDFTKFELNINLWMVAIGAVVGYLLLLGVRFLLPTRQVGLIVLILSVASTSSLFSYIFILHIRNFALSMALGVGLGALLHIIITPSSIKDLL